MEKLSQLNLNRYYSPVVELVGIVYTALGVALSYAAVALHFSGFVSFVFTAAVFFAVAAMYAFLQFLSNWQNLRDKAAPKFFKLKLLISSLATLISMLLLWKLQCLPFMLNSENLWPSNNIENAGLWLPLFLFLVYLILSRNAGGVFKAWIKAVLIAASAATFLFIAVFPQQISMAVASGLFAPCWLNVLACAYLDRHKDFALNIPSIMGRNRKFPMKVFLAINSIILVSIGYNSVSVFFSGVGLVFYLITLFFLVQFEEKMPLYIRRWLPDLLLFTAFL